MDGVPEEWTPFRDEVDTVPCKMDSRAMKRITPDGRVSTLHGRVYIRTRRCARFAAESCPMVFGTPPILPRNNQILKMIELLKWTFARFHLVY